MRVWSRLFFPSTLSNNSKRTTNAAFKMSEINACARNLPTVYSAQASRLHEIPHARVSPNSCLHIIRGISPRLRLEGWSGAGLFGGVPDRWSATLLSNGSMSLKTPSSNPIPKKEGGVWQPLAAGVLIFWLDYFVFLLLLLLLLCCLFQMPCHRRACYQLVESFISLVKCGGSSKKQAGGFRTVLSSVRLIKKVLFL